MSTNVNLNAQDNGKMNAIHAYLDKLSIQHGMGRVFLIPEFEEENGEWKPVLAGNGTRPAKDNAAFCRLGKKSRNLDTQKAVYTFTNMFFNDGEEELVNLLLEHGVTYGNPITTCRVVVHEQCTPFSRTSPDRDIKWADKANNLACMKQVVDTATGEATMANIYRRVKAFFAVEGEYSANAVNKLVAHDNGADISEAAYQKFNALRQANTSAISQTAAARVNP